jgi:outer membrane protein TolC
MKAAAARVESKRAQVSYARSAFGPKLLAQASYGRLDSDFFPQDEDWAVGVVLQVPIFNFAKSHNLAQARSELVKEELNRKKLELSAPSEVWNARSGVSEAWESTVAARALVADAAESLRMARERYAAGAGTITDLLDAETNMARSEMDRVRAEYGYRVALSALKKAMGELTGE